jgi:hypothetical protein
MWRKISPGYELKHRNYVKNLFFYYGTKTLLIIVIIKIDWSNALCFSPEYEFSYAGGNGIRLENGTWTGLVGMLQSGDSHLTAEGLSMTKSRKREVDFIAPIWVERWQPTYGWYFS